MSTMGPGAPGVTYQQIIEQLLRSRLYRIGVVVELDSGETSEGLVREVVYDGSNSTVLMQGESGSRPARKLQLARITRVDVARPGDAA